MQTFQRNAAITLFVVVMTLLVFSNIAMAQVERPSEANLQFTGVIPKTATGNGITDDPTRSGGISAGYTFMFKNWMGIEGTYGWTRNTQNYSGDFGTAGVQANLHEITGAFVVKPGLHLPRIQPYVLAGPAALRFNPTSSDTNMVGALSQTKAAFVYGGGADVAMTQHLGLRVDYRGFVTKPPDFTLSSLTVGSTTHLAQPSVGIFFRF